MGLLTWERIDLSRLDSSLYGTPRRLLMFAASPLFMYITAILRCSSCIQWLQYLIWCAVKNSRRLGVWVRFSIEENKLIVTIEYRPHNTGELLHISYSIKMTE